MHVERITNPASIDRNEVAAILERGHAPTVQFSAAGYTPQMLQELDALCAEFGAMIEVRFYEHARGGFDAAILAHLPHVRWLGVNSLMSIVNEEYLWHLPALERLTFGVFRFDRPDFLAGLALEKLTSLSVAENQKRNLDLASLERCDNLEDLFIQGHTRNIAAVAGLPKLETLRLSCIPKRLDLAFVSNVAALRSLYLLLGGRVAIDEICHARLERLHVDRVRGLATLGSLRRFPALRHLRVEDELQLREISVSGVRLHELFLFNCKNLARIDGLSEQDELVHFRTARTALNLDYLLKHDWPPSMRYLALYSGSEKWNKAAREELESRGYREFSSAELEPT